ALGTSLCGLCYCFAGAGQGFWLLLAALLLGGVGAATQHPIGSALVTRVFSGPRALTAFGTYNFAGDVGKVLLPAAATSLILIITWRPPCGLVGAIGLAAGVAIFLATPRLPRERAATCDAPRLAAVADRSGARGRLAYAALATLGIAESVVRGAFF